MAEPNFGWPRLMSSRTAAAYLDLTEGEFVELVAQHIPVLHLEFGLRWDIWDVNNWVLEMREKREEREAARG